jgi:hypothetical protein
MYDPEVRTQMSDMSVYLSTHAHMLIAAGTHAHMLLKRL